MFICLKGFALDRISIGRFTGKLFHCVPTKRIFPVFLALPRVRTAHGYRDMRVSGPAGGPTTDRFGIERTSGPVSRWQGGAASVGLSLFIVAIALFEQFAEILVFTARRFEVEGLILDTDA